MNIKDIGVDVPVDVTDMLIAMFEHQKGLMPKYMEIEKRNGYQIPDGECDLNDRHWQLRIKELTYRVIEELSEATNTLKNKPWKTSPVPTDAEHFLEELSDALHFFLELCIVIGLSPQDLYALYFKKNQVNQFRQRSGY